MAGIAGGASVIRLDDWKLARQGAHTAFMTGKSAAELAKERLCAELEAALTQLDADDPDRTAIQALLAGLSQRRRRLA
jgi:hypothetical protein